MTFYSDLLALIEAQIESEYSPTLSDLGQDKPYPLTLESLLSIRAVLSTSDSPSYHPDTLDYLSRLALAGGSISQPNTDLLDTQIRQLYTDGLRGSIKYWLCLNLTQSFTGCLVPIYDDGVGNATNNNFVSGDWSVNGLTGNGSNKYLDSGWNPDTRLGTFSNAGRFDVHFACKVANHNTNASSDYRGLMGGGGGFNKSLELYTFDNSNIISFFMTTGSELLIAGNPAGVTLSNRRTDGSLRLLQNGTLADSTSSLFSPILSPDYNIAFFALNDPVGTISYHSLATISSFTMGYGLDTAQETALTNILNAF